jgi:hypothetical protein
MKTAEKWQDAMDPPLPLTVIRAIQSNALEAAAAVVKRYCSPCRCGPEWQRGPKWRKRHAPECLHIDGEEMVEGINALKPKEER